MKSEDEVTKPAEGCMWIAIVSLVAILIEGIIFMFLPDGYGTYEE